MKEVLASIINGVVAHVLNFCLQFAEKDGNLVFTLNEQDLDCSTMEMISQRLERVCHFLLCPTLEVSLSCMYPKD